MKNNTVKATWTIFGAGNFIFDLLDAISANNEIVNRIVLNTKISKTLLGSMSIRTETIEEFRPRVNEKYIFGFLNPNKEQLLLQLKPHNITFSNLIHPRAYISNGVKMGVGNFYGAGSIIGPMALIGNYNYFNRGSLVGHNVVIDDFNHIGPGAIICGGCMVKNKCFIGAGSVVNNDLSICSDVIIGSQSGVVRSIVEPGTYVGTPAIKIGSK